LAFVGIVGAAIFFFCYRRKKRNNVSFGGGRYKNNSNSNNIGSSSNNILGVVAGKIKKNNNNNNNNNSRASLHEIHDGSSVLGGYESLASQRHLVSGQNNYSNESPSRKTPPQLPPPLNTTSLDHSDDMLPFSSGPVPPMEEFYEVRHPYPPQMGDELGLHVGDIVCVAMNFDDGWALGFNVTTGLKGVFPLVCVAPAPEEVLEQLLQPSDPQDYSNKTLVEDGGHYGGAHYNSYNSQNSITMQQIRENLRRSLSISSRNTHNTLPTTELTQHSSIPRRTASIMRNSYGYHEADSPTSPTLNTPFFDVTLLSNNPSSEQHRINPPIETIELHRANNRVSKLEESD
jgi:hypothetical protein